MKRNKIIAWMTALVLVMSVMAGYVSVGASTTPETTGASETKAEAAESKEAEVKLEIKYAKNFAIEYMDDDVKLITDSDGRKLLLVPRDGKAPDGYDDAVQIATPLESAMYTSTVYVGFLGSLEKDELYDSICALTTPESHWTTPQILERFASKQITYIAQDHWNAGDIEEIMGVDPEIVFSGGGDESGVVLRGLLDEAEIPYAVVMDYTEADNKANLEWIKFFAAFYNLDKEAAVVYEAKLARLDELYKKTAAIPEADRPTLAYGLVYDGIVYTLGGESSFAQEMEKAGAIYTLKDLEGTGSVQLTMEEFFNKCKDADVLIYGSLPQYCADKEQLLATEPLFEEFTAFKNDKIYGLDKGYYMNSAKVVEKFEDAVAMFHPDLLPDHEFVMYKLLPDVAEDAAEKELDKAG